MMQSNFKIAITGGICSGKTTVADIIKEQGYHVISCDKIYSELLDDISFVDLIAEQFEGAKNFDGSLNRKKLAEIVFNDDDKLKKLNSITHPKIMQMAMQLMIGEGVHFCEVPLLFEGGYEKLFDNVIVVLRNKNERVKELVKRNEMDRKQAILRVNSQFDYLNYDFIKYYVIHNDGNLIDLRKNALGILAKIVKDYN